MSFSLQARRSFRLSNSNGSPVVGAILKIYEFGTTTFRAIYSDAALMIPMTNPLAGVNASNANGQFPCFYMAAGTYKLRAETSLGVLIWEVDNLDTGTSAGSGALPLPRGGTGATTAAAARANLGAMRLIEFDLVGIDRGVIDKKLIARRDPLQ